MSGVNVGHGHNEALHSLTIITGHATPLPTPSPTVQILIYRVNNLLNTVYLT